MAEFRSSLKARAYLMVGGLALFMLFEASRALTGLHVAGNLGRHLCNPGIV